MVEQERTSPFSLFSPFRSSFKSGTLHWRGEMRVKEWRGEGKERSEAWPADWDTTAALRAEESVCVGVRVCVCVGNGSCIYECASVMARGTYPSPCLKLILSLCWCCCCCCWRSSTRHRRSSRQIYHDRASPSSRWENKSKLATMCCEHMLLLLLLHGFHFDLSLTDRRPSGISLLRSAWLNRPQLEEEEEEEESHYYREKPRVETKLVQCRRASTAPHNLPPPPPPNVPLSSGIFTHRTHIFTTEQSLIFSKTHPHKIILFSLFWKKKLKKKYSKQHFSSWSLPFFPLLRRYNNAAHLISLLESEEEFNTLTSWRIGHVTSERRTKHSNIFFFLSCCCCCCCCCRCLKGEKKNKNSLMTMTFLQRRPMHSRRCEGVWISHLEKKGQEIETMKRGPSSSSSSFQDNVFHHDCENWWQYSFFLLIISMEKRKNRSTTTTRGNSAAPRWNTDDFRLPKKREE